MSLIPDASVRLIVTSPPYPMIQMWDGIFSDLDRSGDIQESLAEGDGGIAYLKMHEILNRTWKECDRVLADGGWICVNMGDAVRKTGDRFQLYPNHSQIINCFSGLGYSVYPDIHWRKPTNAPNKFMGSGMYPAGAYVTLEHEYILIFRKGDKRKFRESERALRQESAYFWEERNNWFSDLWELNGISQNVHMEPAENAGRKRNASFPLEVPLRLVYMYSIKGDIVLDPFAGFGTTGLACMIANRNSIGNEIDETVAAAAIRNLTKPSDELNNLIDQRILNHKIYIDRLSADKKSKCYFNPAHGFLVKTKQEISIRINHIQRISLCGDHVLCSYR